MAKTFLLPKFLDDGRLDLILKLINQARLYSEGRGELVLDWAKTKNISPAGFAILACLFDLFCEQKNRVGNRNIPQPFLNYPVMNNLKNLSSFSSIQHAAINDFEDASTIVHGRGPGIDPFFLERLVEKFSHILSDDLLYAVRLIVNELMQNSVDHSGAERYYLYAGRHNDEFHLGILDMGIGIPARLEQKYMRSDDLEYLKLAFQKGSSTRRERSGGFGLYYFFDLLKQHEGKLTMISRGAQIRRYFRTRRSQKNLLKYPLPGTWCFARFRLEA